MQQNLQPIACVGIDVDHFGLHNRECHLLNACSKMGYTSDAKFDSLDEKTRTSLQ